MKLTRTLKVSETEFYDYLEREIITDIYNSTNKKISADNIERGLKYSKYMDDKHARVDMIIQEYQRGSVYKFKYKTLTDMIVISYQSKQTEDGNLYVTFSQEIDSFQNGKKNKLSKSISTALYLGRMSDALYSLQDKIINYRNGVEEPKVQKDQYKLFKKIVAKK